MAHLIDKDALVAEIERRIKNLYPHGGQGMVVTKILKDHYEDFLSFIDTLEAKEVDLEKLGEIARHLIAVKNHIEDMRLDNNEWLLLEKIGYPEQFKDKTRLNKKIK